MIPKEIKYNLHYDDVWRDYSQILENMNYYIMDPSFFLCPSEVKIGPALLKADPDQRTGSFSGPGLKSLGEVIFFPTVLFVFVGLHVTFW